MKKIETLFIGAFLAGAAVFAGAGLLLRDGRTPVAGPDITTPFGAFLAAQHAIYVNDFDRAADFTSMLAGADYPAVRDTNRLAGFLSGYLPDDVEQLKDEKTSPAHMIYDAYLAKNERWGDMYKRHKSDESALTAPLRIWSAVASGHADDALKLIEKLPTNNAWKSFVRGQIHAVAGRADQARAEFEKVDSGFMNLNDYMYVLSFYRAHGMDDAADALRTDFTGRPGGLFVLDYDAVPDWSSFSGYQNALGFSLIQNVSHTQVMMYMDLAVLMLRMAQVVAPNMGDGPDAINYYLGQYFFTNNGDYKTYFNRISADSPFYPFAMLRMAERGGDIKAARRLLRSYPLFVPAINYVLGQDIAQGHRRGALRVINAVLGDRRLNDATHAFFLKSRAQVHFAFGDYNAAASDIHAAADVLAMDAEIMSLQAKIWAAQGREIETAYEYAMNLVRTAPSDVLAWDTLGRVVFVREGADAALDMIRRVAEVSTTCSSLFDLLGDLHVARGEFDAARTAYLRAISLADDGLVVVPQINKKIRKLK